MKNSWRRILFGRPLASDKLQHQRLRKLIALPVFASDALSSTAYATQEILLVVCLAGAAGIQFTLPVSIAIVSLLAIVIFSYEQTVHAYPKGGGSYIVSRENLNTFAGLTAAASILTDYVLTVAVSISSGVQQITSFFPALADMNLTVPLCMLAIGFVTLMNLRGAKESGTVFALPTYVFMMCIFAMIGLGLIGPLFGYHTVPHAKPTSLPVTEGITLFLLLKAFASGCSAMTGVEAISDGVQAFRPPESRNAGITLVMMGCLLGAMFLGISWLAQTNNVTYLGALHGGHAESVISQVARAVFGGLPTDMARFAQGAVLFSTAIVLVLAANTAYADFPRLSAILAGDRFMPRQLSNLGDRLVFANGIVLLGLFAAVLVIVFKGVTDALIPLYAFGVFMSFTLSQSGMVMRWWRLRPRGWQFKAGVNLLGACTTALVLTVIVIEKWEGKVWISVVIVALLVMMFYAINKHYEKMRIQLRMPDEWKPNPNRPHTVLVLMDRLHRGTSQALEYAQMISKDVRAVRVEVIDSQQLNQMVRREWADWGGSVPLVNLASPYRSLFEPIVEYVQQVIEDRPDHLVTVIVPEFTVSRWYYRMLHANHAPLLRMALGNVRGVIVTNLRFYTD